MLKNRLKKEICATELYIKKQQANLRKTILLHKNSNSNAHLYMERIIHKSKFDDISKHICWILIVHG